jgi:hypothetical protein
MKADDRPRLTARIRHGDDLVDRDLCAGLLAAQISPCTPVEGDQVRLTYGDGRTLQGCWGLVGDRDPVCVIRTDDGVLHFDIAAPAAVEIVHRVARPRLPLLTEAEARVVACLLGEVAGVYTGEPLGALATEMVTRLLDRLGAI